MTIAREAIPTSDSIRNSTAADSPKGGLIEAGLR